MDEINDNFENKIRNTLRLILESNCSRRLRKSNKIDATIERKENKMEKEKERRVGKMKGGRYNFSPKASRNFAYRVPADVA